MDDCKTELFITVVWSVICIYLLTVLMSEGEFSQWRLCSGMFSVELNCLRSECPFLFTFFGSLSTDAFSFVRCLM